MVLTLLNDTMEWVNRRFETRFFHSNYWLVYIVFIAVCLSFFFSFPRMEWKSIEDGHWNTIVQQAEGKFMDPSIFENLDIRTHEAKRYYRITLPLLARILHLNILGMLIVQFILTTLNYYLLASFVYKLTSNKRVTTYLLFASALAFSFRLGYNELGGHFDILPLLLFSVSMSFKRPVFVFLSVFFACWSDERAIITSLIPLLYWYQVDEKFNSKQVLSVIAGVVAYSTLRIIVQMVTGYETPVRGGAVGPECMIYTVPIFIPNLIRSLEGFWILVIVYLYYLKEQNKKLLLTGALVVILLTLIGSLMVFDISRSMAYLIPIVYLCLYKVKDVLSEKFAFIILICCFVYPSNTLFLNEELMVSGNLAIYEIGRWLILHIR